MEDLKTIQDLLSRANAAEAPDRELDADVWLAFTPGATRTATTVTSSTDSWSPYVIDETRDPSGKLITVPAFTASVDEALKLIRQFYPAIGIILESGYRGPYSCCTLRKQDGPAFTTGSMIGQYTRPDDEMALAMIAAFLMAREFESENSEEPEAA